MRKNLLSILATSIFLFSSCSKQKEIEAVTPAEQLYPLNLSVSTFNTEVVGMGSNGKLAVLNENTSANKSLSSMISRLDYAIYNSSGIQMKNSSQLPALPSFGTISENLPAGDYKIYLAGGQSGTSFYSSGNGYNVSISAYGIVSTEIFTKALDVTVSAEAKSHSIVMDRAVGKLEVQLTDSIPSNVAKVSVTSGASSSIYFYQANDEMILNQSTVDAIVTATDLNKPNFTINKYVVPYYSGSITSDVTIKAFDATGLLLANKVIKSVKVEKNKKTILSGKLFTQPIASAATGFAISINSDWNSQTNNFNF